MGEFALVEACAGSAALTMRLCGAARPLTPYQGGKARLCKPLMQLLSELSCTELSEVYLSDRGAWGHVWPVLVEPGGIEQVLSDLQSWSRRDPREVYDSLHRATLPSHPPTAAAAILFLQRLAHSGKAVAAEDGLLKSPGFNKTSAYGKAGTERFGPIKPMVPALIRGLQAMGDDFFPSMRWAVLADASFWLDQLDWGGGPIVVYIDPPYASSTPYPGGRLPRGRVVQLALQYAELGAIVIVSEAEPIRELVKRGWSTRCLRSVSPHGSPFRSRKAEWVTFLRADDYSHFTARSATRSAI